jgi:hypothetical protein
MVEPAMTFETTTRKLSATEAGLRTLAMACYPVRHVAIHLMPRARQTELTDRIRAALGDLDRAAAHDIGALPPYCLRCYQPQGACAECEDRARDEHARAAALREEHDLAIARAERAERERDEARADIVRRIADLHSLRRQFAETEADAQRWADAYKQAREDSGRLAEERDRVLRAAHEFGADLVTIGALCGIRDDEYPLAAVRRVVAERDEAHAQLSEETDGRALAEDVAAALSTELTEAQRARAQCQDCGHAAHAVSACRGEVDRDEPENGRQCACPGGGL